MAGVGDVIEARKTAIDKMVEARRLIQQACDGLSAGLARLAPFGEQTGELAATYQRALNDAIAQLVVIDNALAKIPD